MGSGDVLLQWAAVLGLVGSVVAAFYYLRLIKTMWFDAPVAGVDKPQPTARAVGYRRGAVLLPDRAGRADLAGPAGQGRRGGLWPRVT